MNGKRMQEVAVETLEILLAIEVLEYHNKNFLANPASLSKQKIELIESALREINQHQMLTREEAGRYRR